MGENTDRPSAKVILSEQLNAADDSDGVVVIRVYKNDCRVVSMNVEPGEARKILETACEQLKISGY